MTEYTIDGCVCLNTCERTIDSPIDPWCVTSYNSTAKCGSFSSSRGVFWQTCTVGSRTDALASSANPLATGHNEVWRKWQAAPIRTNALRTALCSSPLKTQGHGCKPPSRFEGWLAGDDSIAVVQELGDADGSREPQLLRFDCLVAMSEEIAQPDDRRPRNFRMLRLHLTRHAIRGLAHNKECPLQRGSGRSLAFARELSERH